MIEKFAFIFDAIGSFDYLMVHINPRSEGVELPASQKSALTLTLQIGYGYCGDLSVDEVSIDANFIFGGSHARGRVPLTAIWAATTPDGKHTIWPKEAPEPALAYLLMASSPVERPSEVSKEEKPKPKSGRIERGAHLRRVK